MKKVTILLSTLVILLFVFSTIIAQTVSINAVTDTLRFSTKVLQNNTSSLTVKIARGSSGAATTVSSASVLAGTYFSLSSSPSGSVASGDTVVATLQFTPNTSGLFLDSLQIVFNNGYWRIIIKGTGATFLYGDVNQNNTINSTDAAEVLRHVVGKTASTGYDSTSADVTANGSVSAYDASYILRYAASLISAFPGGSNLAKDNLILKEVGFDRDNIKEAGEYLMVPIYVTAQNVFSIQSSISFDASLLEFEGVHMSDVDLKSAYYEEKAHSGRIDFALASFMGLDTKGDILFLKFKMLKPEKGKGNLTVNKLLVNEDACDVFGVNLDRVNNAPYDYYLSQNYPNPFNSETIIKYGIPNQGFVTLNIYNLTGQLVRTLVNEEREAGKYEIKWNGRNEAGSEVASGVYLYVIRVKDFRQVNKMIYIK